MEELYTRASARDPGISIATVYRTVKLFEEAGILDKLEFGDGRARYEDAERDRAKKLRGLTAEQEELEKKARALKDKIEELPRKSGRQSTGRAQQSMSEARRRLEGAKGAEDGEIEHRFLRYSETI